MCQNAIQADPGKQTSVEEKIEKVEHVQIDTSLPVDATRGVNEAPKVVKTKGATGSKLKKNGEPRKPRIKRKLCEEKGDVAEPPESKKAAA
jgi:hypothetical protein